MTRWYMYYCLLHAIWDNRSLRVELEDVLNHMLAESRDSIAEGERPTTLQLRLFMNHMAPGRIKFKQHELAHLIRIEGWCL